jgi:hypothetical protein
MLCGFAERKAAAVWIHKDIAASPQQHGGKPVAYRRRHTFTAATPPDGRGVASNLIGALPGKAKPFRHVLRHSRTIYSATF